MEFARRLCAAFLVPVLGAGILLPGNGAANSSSSTTTSSTSTSTTSTTATSSSPTLPGVPFWSLERDFFINRLLGATAGGAFWWVLECVIFLRGVVRRVLRVGGFGRRRLEWLYYRVCCIFFLGFVFGILFFFLRRRRRPL
jgi:hypothetical protein